MKPRPSFLFSSLLLMVFPANSCSADSFPYNGYTVRELLAPYSSFADDIEKQFLDPMNIYTTGAYMDYPSKGPSTESIPNLPYRKTQIRAVCPVGGGYLVLHDLRGQEEYFTILFRWDEYKNNYDGQNSFFYPVFWKEGTVYPTVKEAIERNALDKMSFSLVTSESFTIVNPSFYDQTFGDYKDDWMKANEEERARIKKQFANYKPKSLKRIEDIKAQYYDEQFVSKHIDDDRAYAHAALYKARKVEGRSITCYQYYNVSEEVTMLSLDVNGFIRGCGFPRLWWDGTDEAFDDPWLAPVVYRNSRFYSSEEALAQGIIQKVDIDLFERKATVYEYWNADGYYNVPPMAE